MTDEKVIIAENLTKRFGSFVATDHISFSVRRGEIFGFLGANGAGKTTAMRMLCGLSRPSEGRAVVAGFDVASQAEQVKRHIGYMSQKFSLYDDLTVAENMRLFGGIYGMGRRQIAERTAGMLADLGLEGERNSLVKSLPLGWKQKLAFALAIFHEPESPQRLRMFVWQCSTCLTTLLRLRFAGILPPAVISSWQLRLTAVRRLKPCSGAAT